MSLDPKTPEIGISPINRKNAEEKLLNFDPKEPVRKTPEKILQAWIIFNAIQNNNLLPFADNLTFITSELAIVLKDNKRIVNDILAIDKDNNLVVIELKSSRVNKVKEQATKFKEVIESEPFFFRFLTKLMTDRDWSDTIRCVVVWPKAEGKVKTTPQEYGNVEIYQYYDNFKFEICK
ncbi:PDDEXK family nuclease [Dysgonomonas reticulitermitis]